MSTTFRTEAGLAEGVAAEAAGETGHPLVDDVRRFTGKVIIGQEAVVERVLIALFTGGHLLLQGVPGLAKTLLVSAMARAINLQFGRVQFTIDLLPADILGSEVFNQASGSFHVNRGPIFTNVLLADEINRASPKVQSALLEAMQERRVTIGRTTFRLPAPFLTIATQNPVEQAGTFELPEAQLDRFMLCHRLDYPDRDQEARILQLEVMASAQGLIPAIDRLVDLGPQAMPGFRVTKIQDQRLEMKSLDASDGQIQPATERRWTVDLEPDPAAGVPPREFVFPAAIGPSIALEYQRYEDADVATVGPRIPLSTVVSVRQIGRWVGAGLALAVVLLIGAGVLVYALRRRRLEIAGPRYHRPEMVANGRRH